MMSIIFSILLLKVQVRMSKKYVQSRGTNYSVLVSFITVELEFYYFKKDFYFIPYLILIAT